MMGNEMSKAGAVDRLRESNVSSTICCQNCFKRGKPMECPFVLYEEQQKPYYERRDYPQDDDFCLRFVRK